MSRISPAILRFLATSAIALAVPVSALAQASAPAPEPRVREGAPIVMHMLRGLDLTENQRTQIKALADSQREPMRAGMQKVREARRALRELAMSDKYDAAAASAKAEEMARADAELARLSTENMQKIFALLTPEQKARLKARMAQRDQHPPKGPHHPHPGK